MLHTCQSNFPELVLTREKQARSKVKYSGHLELVQRKTGDFITSSNVNSTVAMPRSGRNKTK